MPVLNNKIERISLTSRPYQQFLIEHFHIEKAFTLDLSSIVLVGSSLQSSIVFNRPQSSSLYQQSPLVFNSLYSSLPALDATRFNYLVIYLIYSILVPKHNFFRGGSESSLELLFRFCRSFTHLVSPFLLSFLSLDLRVTQDIPKHPKIAQSHNQ